MNDQPTANDTGKEYPPLTVLPVEGDPRRFYVLGSHEWWYEVMLDPDSCECKGFSFRRACSHVKRARAFRDLGGVEQARKETTTWKQLSEDEKRAVFA